MTMTMLTLKEWWWGQTSICLGVFWRLLGRHSGEVESGHLLLTNLLKGKYQSNVSSTFSEVIISFLFIGQEDKRYPNDLRHIVRSECFSSPQQIWRFREFGQLFWKRGRLIVWFLLNWIVLNADSNGFCRFQGSLGDSRSGPLKRALSFPIMPMLSILEWHTIQQYCTVLRRDDCRTSIKLVGKRKYMFAMFFVIFCCTTEVAEP